MNAFAAYAVLAVACSGASTLIALIGYKSFNSITDAGMWAITVATAAPMAGALGVAYFINESQRSQQRQRDRPLLLDEDMPPGSFTKER